MIDQHYKELESALKFIPSIKVHKELGCGLFGVAFLLTDNKVLKITRSESEFLSAEKLKGLKLDHIVHIYECWKFQHVNKEESEEYYAILEEFVDVVSDRDLIKSFAQSFITSWYTSYFIGCEGRNGTKDDLAQYMRSPEQNMEAIEFTREKVCSEGRDNYQKFRFGKMYDQLVKAYIELATKAPNAQLDFSAENIGFTSDEDLKVFDIQ